MNKLRIDFRLRISTTAEYFWQSVYTWLSKSKSLLDSSAKETFISDHKELSTFKDILNGKTGGSLFSIDVRNDEERETLSIEIIDQREDKVRNINIFVSFCGCPKFYYEELVASKFGDYYDERLRIPNFLKYSRHMIDSSKILMSVFPVLDENGNFHRKVESIERRYLGLAKVNPICVSETESLNIQHNFIHPGKTLLLLNGDYCTPFELDKISRLDWYILSRTNGQWRNKQIQRKKKA